MQYQAVALIPPDTLQADIVATVTRLMEPYDLAHEVAPYKDYIEAEGIARLASAFRLQAADPEALLARFADYDEEAGIDENGLFVMTTLNPDGRWDGWTLRSLQDSVIPVQDLPANTVAHAVVTPDGQWHDFMPGWNWSETQVGAMSQEARDLIMGFAGYIAVMLDCHR